VFTADKIYDIALGTKAAGKSDPVTKQTRFMIGSVSKSFSSLLLAQLIDAGKLKWTDKMTSVEPKFRTKDAALTNKITLQHLFCACTGLPRSDMFLFFGPPARADRVLEDLAQQSPTTAFGKTFQYNNQITAAGGFMAARLLEPSRKRPLQAYEQALKRHVFDTLEMTNTTSRFDSARRADHAMPHNFSLDHEVVPVALENERFVEAVAPAGAIWSTGSDMAKYGQLWLRGGKNAAGKVVISSEGMAMVHRPQVPVGAKAHYAMGWVVGESNGLKFITHSGGTFGFQTQLFLYPELGIGMFTSANGPLGGTLGGTAQTRLIEILFDEDFKATTSLKEKLTAMAKSLEDQKQRRSAIAELPALKSSAGKELAGTYKNDDLGTFTIVRTPPSAGGKKATYNFKAPRFSGALSGQLSRNGKSLVLLSNGPLTGVEFEVGDNSETLTLPGAQTKYVFTRQGPQKL
jgi:CubicO group peptidase (beta-lactamase class C family)